MKEKTKEIQKKSIFNRYKWSVIWSIIILFIYIANQSMGKLIVDNTFDNFKIMISVLPPILILIGLLDVWVPKETMIKYMGKDSKVKGILITIILGSLSAGPLYAAFPIAAILMKKHARFAYVLFFLGVWSSSKLPLMVFEYSAFGGFFTVIHVVSNLVIFLIGSIVIEKMLSKETKDKIYESAKII
ncbi:MAG: permease [Peptostreptococcaceae bacterium]|nr:permease [Peptostreptococcaceae bacterium]